MAQQYRADLEIFEASHAFANRMKAQRGIEFDPTAAARPYEDRLYLRHVPQIETGEDDDPKSKLILLASLKIWVWGAFVAGGLKVAGLF